MNKEGVYSWSRSSIKTRIETIPCFQIPVVFPNVEVEVPLKQGLKLFVSCCQCCNTYFVEVEVPLKQGLKLPEPSKGAKPEITLK